MSYNTVDLGNWLTSFSVIDIHHSHSQCNSTKRSSQTKLPGINQYQYVYKYVCI